MNGARPRPRGSYWLRGRPGKPATTRPKASGRGILLRAQFGTGGQNTLVCPIIVLVQQLDFVGFHDVSVRSINMRLTGSRKVYRTQPKGSLLPRQNLFPVSLT